MKDLKRERLLELLADQTVFGLNADELMELRQLKKDYPHWEYDVSFELAAAAIGLSDIEANENLPASLQTKIIADAEKFFNLNKESSEALNFAPKTTVTNGSTAAEDIREVIEPEPKRPFWQWLGWAAAAAACIALAISLWLMRSQKQQPETAKTSDPVQTPEVLKTPETVKTPESQKTPEIIKTPESQKTPEIIKTPESARTPTTVKTPETVRTPETVKTPAPELTAVQKRERLIASAPDVLQTNWTSAKDNKRISGDVVWSNAQQKGYVRLRDLPALDASKETYQLWIIDEQNEKTPVSGGIFNVSSTGEIIIPINAQLRINKAKQFAISKEKAGGVVATKPDRIVAVAKI